MSLIKFFVLLLTLPCLVHCCKSKAPEPTKPPCPDGFWEVPEGWKCNGGYLSDCANSQKCMNNAYLCNGARDLRRLKKLNNDSNYLEGSPDENSCTDEFCATLRDGRTRRCPGTTRCITPITNYFPGTDVAIGPICSEVTNSFCIVKQIIGSTYEAKLQSFISFVTSFFCLGSFPQVQSS